MELIARRKWTGKSEAHTAVFTWIEGWYSGIPASAWRMNPMICSSVNLLFVMSVLLPVDGLHQFQAGMAGGEQVILAIGLVTALNVFLSKTTVYCSRPSCDALRGTYWFWVRSTSDANKTV